jgi:hypothetical protein
MTNDREEHPRRLIVGSLLLGLGILFLGTGLNRPTIANMRTVDIVHLTGAGLNLGAGLALLVWHLVLRRKG